jgi:putative transposase
MNIRRYYSPGQIVFITQVVKDRKPIFHDPEMIRLLRGILRNVNSYHPFSMLAYVFLPDHFHLLIRPKRETNFSQILHSLKLNFTKAYKQKVNHTESLKLWQKRFWDHVIRNERDLENHIHYIHYNPVNHEYVKDISRWQDSSYRSWYERGLYNGANKWVEPNKSTWGE